jgi:hypothetical protein
MTHFSALLAAGLAICSAAYIPAQQPAAPPIGHAPYAGFDRNDYPGDPALPELRRQFAFVGYWITPPPGETANSWAGTRDILLRNGFGFVVVANGKLDREILRAQRTGTPPKQLGSQNGIAAAASARREGFPRATILFLDQEEGGRLLGEQADYLLAWTEAVARTEYRAGVYASGQPVNEGKDSAGHPITITTVQDIRQRIAAGHLHPVEFWVAQDACPPAPGCVMRPPVPHAAGLGEVLLWQYAQSPRRPEITKACAATYAGDGNCYSPNPARFFIDLSTSMSPDPSHGR